MEFLVSLNSSIECNVNLLTILFVFLFLCTNPTAAEAAAAKSTTKSTAAKARVNLLGNGTIPALYVLGDSILDTGNNNNLKTIIKCNFPPYGRDFLGGKPTGRFCNGKVPSDFFVEALGIKEFLPAYLNPNIQPEDFISGVCFASGGSGFDPLTPRGLLVYPLSAQLQFLRDYKAKLNKMVGEERANKIFKNALFLVSSGNNDIGATYFLVRKFQYDANSYTSFLLAQASTFLKDIYDLGARKIGVLSVIPVGCVPILRTVGGGLGKNCVEELNEVAKLYNAKLSAKLASLNKDYFDAKMFYIDVYNPLLDIIQNKEAYGFEVANRGCCGTGTIETGKICGLNAFSCEDDSTYVFWDGEHPTERAYKIIVSKINLSSMKI